MLSGTKCWRIGCEVRPEGVVPGRVCSLSSRSGQASCLSKIAGVLLEGLKSAAAFVLCTYAGVSELLVYDEWRGSSFPSEKAFSAPREWDGMTATGAVAVQLCVIQTTAVCGVGVGRDWGYTPIWTGHGGGVFVPWPGLS